MLRNVLSASQQQPLTFEFRDGGQSLNVRGRRLRTLNDNGALALDWLFNEQQGFGHTVGTVLVPDHRQLSSEHEFFSQAARTADMCNYPKDEPVDVILCRTRTRDSHRSVLQGLVDLRSLTES